MRPQEVWSATLATAARGSGTVELLDRDREIRRPVLSCRRIGFIGRGFPEQGFLAGWVADRLARRRTGAVLAVNAWSGTPEVSSLPARVSSRAEACAGLSRSGSGLFATALDLSPAAPPSTAWACQVGPVARFFDAVVTDWGMPAGWPEVEAIRSGSAALCIVVRAEPDAVDEAAVLLQHLSRSAVADRPPPLVALVGPHGRARGLCGRLRRQLPVDRAAAVHAVHAVHAVPLRPGRAGHPLRRETRFALLALTAALMREEQDTLRRIR